MSVLNPIVEEIVEDCSNPVCKKPLPPKDQYIASLGGDFEIFCVDCFAAIEITNLRTINSECVTLAEIYV